MEPGDPTQESAARWDDICDVLIAGCGGGGLAAALAASDVGLKPLLIEKSQYLGGSTILSGGTLWIMDNPFLERTDEPDSPLKSMAHLRAVVGEAGPAASEARLAAYVQGSRTLVALLARQGAPLAHSGWPDYYAEREGGIAKGRTVHAPPFDLRTLGDLRRHLRPGSLAVPANSVEVAVLALGPRTPRAAWVWLRVGVRAVRARLLGAELATRGRALIGRILGALPRGTRIWRGTRLTDLVVEDGRVVGAVVDQAGTPRRVQARFGVLLTAGGFARNAALRGEAQQPVGVDCTMAIPEDEGDAIGIGARLGAATALMEEAWWVPGTKPPNSVMLHVWDRCFPHTIIVDANGRRFVNEADPYMEVGQAMLRRRRETGRPAWMILESRHRQRYAFGMTPPRVTPREWFDQGYMKRAETLEELARQCHIDAAAFASTIERFNAMALAGRDEDFRRGDSIYNRFYGDSSHRPNANLGSIERPPFYAVAAYPGDVGTGGGLLADEHARVIAADGAPIQGLYAAGNSSASVFGHAYPGAGASIGASMVFAVLAVRHMAGLASQEVS